MVYWTAKFQLGYRKPTRFLENYAQVLQHKNVSLSTKMKVYNVVVLLSLMFGYETWTLCHRHIKKMEQSHMLALLFMVLVQ